MRGRDNLPERIHLSRQPDLCAEPVVRRAYFVRAGGDVREPDYVYRLEYLHRHGNMCRIGDMWWNRDVRRHRNLLGNVHVRGDANLSGQ